MTRVGGPAQRLRDVARFEGGPLNAQRDPFDLLDRPPPPPGTRRVEFEEGGEERCAEYVCEHRGQSYVWRFLRELDAELGLGDGAYDRTTGEIVDVSTPIPPPPPPPRSDQETPHAPPPPPPPPPPPSA